MQVGVKFNVTCLLFVILYPLYFIDTFGRETNIISCHHLNCHTYGTRLKEFVMEFQYQARTVSGHVHVLAVSILRLSAILIYKILEMFRQCGIILFSFYYIHTLIH